MLKMYRLLYSLQCMYIFGVEFENTSSDDIRIDLQRDKHSI